MSRVPSATNVVLTGAGGSHAIHSVLQLVECLDADSSWINAFQSVFRLTFFKECANAYIRVPPPLEQDKVDMIGNPGFFLPPVIAGQLIEIKIATCGNQWFASEPKVLSGCLWQSSRAILIARPSMTYPSNAVATLLRKAPRFSARCALPERLLYLPRSFFSRYSTLRPGAGHGRRLPRNTLWECGKNKRRCGALLSYAIIE